MDSKGAIYRCLWRSYKDFEIVKNLLILIKIWFTIVTYKDWTCLIVASYTGHEVKRFNGYLIKLKT